MRYMEVLVREGQPNKQGDRPDECPFAGRLGQAGEAAEQDHRDPRVAVVCKGLGCLAWHRIPRLVCIGLPGLDCEAEL